MNSTEFSTKNTQIYEEPVDFLEQLKQEISIETSANPIHYDLVEVSHDEFYQNVISKGAITSDDFSLLLQQEEKLQNVISVLVYENQQLKESIKVKQGKVDQCIDVFSVQRQWVHGLLEDNLALRESIEQVEKFKALNEKEVLSQIALIKNEKEGLEGKVVFLQQEQDQIKENAMESEERVKKATGTLKSMQLQNDALSEKIVMMNTIHTKYKIYLGLVGAVATIFFAVLVVSWLNMEKQPSGNQLSLTKNETPSDNKILATPADLTASDSANSVVMTSDGFVTNEGESAVGNNDTPINVISDSEVENILKSSINTTNTMQSSNTNTAKPKIDKPSSVVSNKASERASIASKQKVTKTYVVQKSDTLYSISKKFYNDGNHTAKIKKDNNLNGHLKPGQKIKIVLNEE